MSKKLFFVSLFFLAILIIGGLVVYFQKDVSPIPVTDRISPVEILLTDSGFSTSSATIKINTPVRFVNNSSGPMWVASTPHPIHTDLPGFDQLSVGNVYFYTFNKVGTWKFHNHMNSTVSGQITVVSN